MDLKSNYLVHFIAAVTIVLGVWLFLGDSTEPPVNSDGGIAADAPIPASNTQNQTDPTATADTAHNNESSFNVFPSGGSKPLTDGTNQLLNSSSDNKKSDSINVEAVVNDFIYAWRNKDKAAIDKLWASIKDCDACLLRMVDLIVNKSLEEGMMLEIAIKMAALDTDLVLPVFDTMIDPAGDSSTAIILSEKLVNNGRPEFVTKVFDVIYQAQQNGYENFARQMTWVISKLENHDGLRPILDTITGRVLTTPDFSDHVSRVFSRVVHNIPDSSGVASVIADYYQNANAQEQQRLWDTIKQHEDTLVLLAVNAERNGQNYDVRKYANTIAQLPSLQAAQGIMKLRVAVEYAPSYMSRLLAESVQKNPTVKVLQKLEDYMRDPNMDLDTRLFAAEGLLSVRDNRHARYMLEKVINNPDYADPELQAYIGGRL